jgi:hypothetical protein
MPWWIALGVLAIWVIYVVNSKLDDILKETKQIRIALGDRENR